MSIHNVKIFKSIKEQRKVMSEVPLTLHGTPTQNKLTQIFHYQFYSSYTITFVLALCGLYKTEDSKTRKSDKCPGLHSVLSNG